MSNETDALLDLGTGNDQITKLIAEFLGTCDRKSVTIPVASLYQEQNTR